MMIWLSILKTMVTRLFSSIDLYIYHLYVLILKLDKQKPSNLTPFRMEYKECWSYILLPIHFQKSKHLVLFFGAVIEVWHNKTETIDHIPCYLLSIHKEINVSHLLQPATRGFKSFHLIKRPSISMRKYGTLFSLNNYPSRDKYEKKI